MDQTKENKHDDYSPTVDYLAYSRLRDVNVIPEADYKALVAEVFQTITDQLRATYGPYGRQVMMNQGMEKPGEPLRRPCLMMALMASNT